MRAAVAVVGLLGLGACGRLGFDARAGETDGGAGLDVPASSYAGLVLADGPRAYYRFDDGALAQAAHDATGNGNDATFDEAGGTITQGIVGALGGDPDPAIAFFGQGNTGPATEAKALLPAVGSTWAGDFSIEAFIHPLGTPPSTYSDALFICEVYETSGFRTGWNKEFKLQMWTNESGATSNFLGSVAFNPAGWTHVVFERRGTSAVIYQDGLEVLSTPLDYIPPTSDAACGIGAFSGMPTHGDFDELAIYDYALTPDQVAAHVASAR